MPTTKTKPKKKPELTGEPVVSATKSANDLPPAATEAPAVIPEETSVITRHVLSSNMGLTIIGDPTFEDWEEIVATYTHVYDKSQWWIGDAIAYGEGKFGEKYAQAVNITGRKLDTLKNIVSVCQRVQLSRRNEKLSFTHHARIAGLPYQTGDELLIRAQRERWNTDELAEEVAKINELAGIPSKPGRKSKKSIARQVAAASGKDPQIPEEERPLFWNGYPLSVMVMPDATRVILQGSEPLPTEEADRAAHHFKHAHVPALASWLEEHNFRKEGENPCAQTTTSTNSDKSNSQPSPTAPEQDTSEKTASASSGASVVQPDAAPKIPMLKWRSMPVTIYKAAVMVGDEAMGEAEFETAVQSLGFPSRNDLMEYLETWGMRYAPYAQATAQAASEPVAAQVEPKATPEDVTAKIDALYLPIIEALKSDMEKAVRERDEARAIIATWKLKETTGTPIEIAESAILAFNHVSQQVDWKAVGQSELSRKKWLGNLLRVADETIDLIQGQPITPRK